ncbi:hypothetical protein [Streptomyces sp. NPDC001450]
MPVHDWRTSAADARRALSPRGALPLHDVDGALLFAARSALAMGLVAVPIVAAGRPDLAVYAVKGSSRAVASGDAGPISRWLTNEPFQR